MTLTHTMVSQVPIIQNNISIVAVHRGSYTYNNGPLNGGPKITTPVYNFITEAKNR